MLQLQAGYFMEELLPKLIAGAGNGAEGEKQVRQLLRSLSWFEVAGTQPFGVAAPEYDNVSPHALWTVAVNLLTRGLPTRAPLPLTAATLAENWPVPMGLFDVGGRLDFGAIDTDGSLKFPLTEERDPAAWAALLWRAFHPLDPRLRPGKELRQQLGTWQVGTVSNAEIDFVADILPAHGGAAYLPQLLSSQTSLENLLRWSDDEDEQLHKTDVVKLGDFARQEADFTLALPYQEPPAEADKPAGTSHAWPAAIRGIVLEVDGPQHKVEPQRQKDGKRDAEALKVGWLPLRLSYENHRFEKPAEQLQPLRHLLQAHPYFAQLQANYDDSLLASVAGRQALQLTLGPLAVARVQRVLLEALLQEGRLGSNWRLAVVERDVPCAQQAVTTLLTQLRQLYALEGKGRELPAIKLHVFPSGEFAQPTYLTHAGTQVMEPGSAPRPDDKYDLLLDVSMLQRPGFSTAPSLPGVQCLTLRTATRPREPRRFRSAPLIAYPALVAYNPAHETYESDAAQLPRVAVLTELVQDIFRKRTLREGQLPIISRGLQGLSVLGLLPTGGGKSLTYQMAVLLQPGVALVVAPIKSLMQDQFEGLARNWIDGASFLNSAVPGRARKALRLKRLQTGELLFLLVSPERLVIKADFRDKLDEMADPEAGAPRVAFSYCVIDEAHCVSEWGHDFRTPYLRLGANARTFCHTYDGRPLPLYGLTATASFDVLADVQRELDLDQDQGAVVRTAMMARPELHIRIVAVTPTGTGKDAVPQAKHARFDHLLTEIPADLRALDQQPALTPSPEPNGPPAPPPVALGQWTATDFYQPGPHQKSGQAGLVFCPTKTGAVGVKSIFDRLRAPARPGPPLRVGYFMGSDNDSPTKDDDQKNMSAMQTAFVTDQLNLMVATKAFGMGIDKPNVRFTVHYGYPASIESFVQEGGRAGRDRAVALNYILYHPSDVGILNFFFTNAFKEREQEARVMQELLTRITFPSGECGALNAALAEQFPEWELWGRLHTEKGATAPKALYVNSENGLTYYTIDFSKLPNLQGYDEKLKPAGPPALLREVGNFTMSFLLALPAEARCNATALGQALGAGGAPASIDGILPRWEAMKEPGAPNEAFEIGFRNGKLREMCEAAAAVGISLTEKYLMGCCSGVASGAAFAGAVSQKFWENTGQSLPPGLVRILEKKFAGVL